MDTNIFMIFVSGVLINNFVLSRFLGICPFLGVSKRLETALGMSLAVLFVSALSSVFTFVAYEFLLAPFGLQYMYTVAFVLIMASFVQLTEMILKKYSPLLHKSLGIYLPLLTTNCAILGVLVLNMQSGYGMLSSVINAIGVSVGFALAIMLFAGIRERLVFADVPKCFQGFPIAMIIAGLMSIAFLGFAGLA